MKLEDFAIDHDYYCSDSNYYSSKAAQNFNTWKDFYNEWSDADIDYNLCFRFDIKPINSEDISQGYMAFVFIILQRKGIFMPITIHTIEEEDVDQLKAYLQPHYDKLQSIWKPFPLPTKSNFS